MFMIDLGDILDLHHTDMGEGVLDALLENGHEKVENAVIRVDGIVQIRKGVNVHKVLLGSRAGEKDQIGKDHEIDEKHPKEQKLPDLQQRVGIRVAAHPVVEIDAEQGADPPVQQRQEKHHHQHQHRDDEIGGHAVCVQ